MRYAKIALVALALAALAVAGATAGAVKGETPPDFTGTALDGRKITLSEFRGKNPVVLNFYADFCPQCKKEFPHLKSLDEKLGAKGLRIVSVSLDEDRATAANIPNDHRVKFPVIFDPKGGIAGKYNVQAIPHTVVIGRDGKVNTVLIGYNPDALDRAVEQVMR
jgi:peroxiredoxin